MTPIVDLIVSELPRHVEGILWEDRLDVDGHHGTSRWDTGGLRCACGHWQSTPTGAERTRPYHAYLEHVAQSIAARLGTPEVIDALTAINERLILPRIGLSMMREMDRDLVTLQAAATVLTAFVVDPSPLLYCPHWSPGSVTVRRGCTSCEAEARR